MDEKEVEKEVEEEVEGLDCRLLWLRDQLHSALLPIVSLPLSLPQISSTEIVVFDKQKNKNKNEKNKNPTKSKVKKTKIEIFEENKKLLKDAKKLKKFVRISDFLDEISDLENKRKLLFLSDDGEGVKGESEGEEEEEEEGDDEEKEGNESEGNGNKNK